MLSTSMAHILPVEIDSSFTFYFLIKIVNYNETFHVENEEVFRCSFSHFQHSKTSITNY